MIKNKSSLANTLATILALIVGLLVLAALILIVRQWF